jgi:post-segregation antitoxin (ccd killing protein)
MPNEICAEARGLNMSKVNEAAAALEARRQAKEVWAKQQDAERNEARDKLRRKEDEKTARLKALRLAKEAADRASGATISPGPLRRRRVVS